LDESCCPAEFQRRANEASMHHQEAHTEERVARIGDLTGKQIAEPG
jgi:aspartate oxidase